MKFKKAETTFWTPQLHLELSSFEEHISNIRGHVDVTAEVIFVHSIDKSWLVKLKIKDINLSKYLIEKASITINGVSLTISKVYKNYLYLNIIPHTLKLTNLKKLKKKDIVNVELDIFGKYIYKYSN